MRRRDEKRQEFHEALLQTLYPPSSPPSLSSSPSPVEVVDNEPFDVTLINPEDYLKISSSDHEDDNEIGDETGIFLKEKMLKEEAARRKKVIGPLLPTDMFQTPNERVADSNGKEEASCLQPVRPNAQEKEEKFHGDDKTRKVKKRREAKKLAKESSKPTHIHDPTPDFLI